MRTINVLLTILMSVGLALLVFEGGLRLLGFAPPASINVFDPTLGWVKRPDAEVGRSTPEFDITFATNSAGLRDDEIALEKQAGVFRVMVLGDSFVLGYTVDRHDLFVDQLEGWWESEERRVQVINAGTEGYSTDQQTLWFREHGRRYQPDVVVLFPYQNDIYWNGQARYNRYPKPRFAPDGTLETGKLQDPGKTPFLAKLAATNALRAAAAPKHPHPSDPHAFQPESAGFPILREFAPLLKQEPEFVADALARTKGAMRALQQDCSEVGARLYVCPIPAETAVHPDEREAFRKESLGSLPDDAWSPMKPVNQLIAIASELGIETMDPRQALQAGAQAGERLYFKDEWHFNPAGNVAMTRFLYNEFENRAIFPEAHRALKSGGIPAHAPERGVPTFVFVFLVLWALLSVLYAATYRDEPVWAAPLKVGALLAMIFTIAIGGTKLVGMLPPRAAMVALLGFVLLVLGFVAYKLGRRLGTIAELLKAFTLRGHWYLMPLVVILLTIGSLLVVAASSPLVAPFIYTLF